MLKELQSLRVFESHAGIVLKSDPTELTHLYELLFMHFYHELSGYVDMEEFRAETKRMVLD